MSEVAKIYQCHCSECRKITGSSENTSCIVNGEKFQWISGIGHITSYTGASGYTSHFCCICGCPVPNKMKLGNLYWVPVGSLAGELDIDVTAHLCVASKALWDDINQVGVQYQDVPNIEELLKLMEVHTPYPILSK